MWRPDLQQQCLDKIPERDVEGEEGFFGSDMEEVLSALGEDDANFAEIKKYKQGLQNKRKKKMRSDQQVPGRGRGKGKGKGKRKGRGKGKGKGKGRGRQGTFAERQMLKRRREEGPEDLPDTSTKAKVEESKDVEMDAADASMEARTPASSSKGETGENMLDFGPEIQRPAGEHKAADPTRPREARQRSPTRGSPVPDPTSWLLLWFVSTRP